MAADLPPRDALRTLLGAKLQSLADAAHANGGEVPGEPSANADRLARLVQMQRELAAPVRSGHRWRMAALFIALLALLSVLLIATVRKTEVELELVVSELRFTLASRQQLSEALQLSSLDASGLLGVELPGALAGTQGATRVLLQAAQLPGGGTISLAPLVAPKGAAVSLIARDAPNELRLSVKGLDTPVRAVVDGSVDALLPYQTKQTIHAATPQACGLTPGRGDVDLDLVALKPEMSLLAPSLAISMLDVVRVDEVSQGGLSVERRVSTLHSGRVFFDELAGRELTLRPRETLRFDAVQGAIRQLRFVDGRLIVNFHGTVRGMSSGPSDFPRNLMPSWLEWLRASQPLALLWGSVLSLFGLLATLWQWWKKNA
ncbi:MAG: hypothetical protein WA210_12485 [Burkholderiaceae bacterium]